ncbi:hypothetical protein JTE90_018427 [Oedothorax gibbosus]|uniref:long-chain-fatty-acid--CoA ligase n=1 Tax=Oedothorax gibbosus TaxID=931172 RepID=A0AAV6UZL4_9ARAC|nr:hypothetical protein JTE90_018427 [Oedothorax gibbosus]
MWSRSVILHRLIDHCHSLEVARCTHPFVGRTAVHKISPLPPQHKKQRVVRKEVTFKHGTKRIQVDPPPSVMQSQSVLLPGPERIRASGATNDPEQFLQFPDENTRTICDALIIGSDKTSTGECLGSRTVLENGESGRYEWITYSEVIKRKNHIASGLLNLNLTQTQPMIGICTKTRPEFVVTMLGCSHYSLVLVPLYHCFGADVLAQIINQVDMEVVICETPKNAADIMEKSDMYSTLKHIILIEGTDEEITKLKNSNFIIHTFKDLEMSGKLYPKPPKKPNPDDLFCLCYTSGTTGVPKGVMVTHRNVLSCIAGVDTVLGDSIPNSYAASIMCYLPCAHIYEIVNEIFAMFHGARLGFYSGNTEHLLSDIAELKPSVLPLVPKLMNLIYFGVEKKMGLNPLRRLLFRLSLNLKEKNLKKGLVSKTAVLDKLVLSRVQKILGGCVQMIFTSSAPVSKEVMHFFRCSMGCLVFEAYGLSEVGAAAMTLMSEHDTGFVGPPLPCNHIKLTSVPELQYMAENDVGEICIRGSNVFSGYYKNPEITAEAIDPEGWYHTGDIGKWLPNGALAVIDRKKHIFKLSQGEYVIPEKSENAYIQSPMVSQIYVDGNSDQEFIVAVVVPEEKPFMTWAKNEGFEGRFENLCQNKELKRRFLSHLFELGKEKKLKSLNQVGNIFLSPEQFTIENGLLTPTMKLKRFDARKRYEKAVKELYTEGNLRKTLKL